MKQKIGNCLIVFGIVDALYMYSAALTGRLTFFSNGFLELVALFVVSNFFAIFLLVEPRKIKSSQFPARLQNRVRFIR
jgi:hypothetical protein